MTPVNAAMGQAGMPDPIRITVEGFGAHPQHKARARASSRARDGGLRAAGAIALWALLPCGRACAAAASARFEFPAFDAYISALPSLDRDEIAALALTLGILCFAVVTALLFVRTRRRLAEVEAAARDEAVASKAAIDRAYALFLSEPQILVAWPAAADEPEIIGDPTLVSPADASVLAFATWLEADAAEAIERGIELFEHGGRSEILRAHEAAAPYSGRVAAVVTGERRSFDVMTVPAARGSAGIGVDATEAELMRAELKRMMDAHRRTLDQLATGVAIFGSDRRLCFYNAAYRSLWDLDAAFLEQGPTDSAVLDRLRAARKLPDEQDFRQWKSALYDAYRAVEAKEHMWHLPHGRTMRVVTTPNPEGGVIYLFDDVTERLDLERRYDALIRVQRDTLDNLTEAVAVFASDGRLRLYNPAFARMWRLSPDMLSARPHIESISDWTQPLHGDDPIWQRLRATITAIDNREPAIGRLERRHGSVVDCATMPLPDGATLVTFQDVTDTVNVERALRERNEALKAADKLKTDFVHHVSYELRSPLTNIIGFAHFLGDPVTGALTEKQREYLSYITGSTNALLAIINNILDLASIDAGAMTLNLGAVDIRKTMEAAAEGVQDRLVKNGIRLEIRAAPDIGSFIADERRVRQSLFNLLANAVGFSPAGETITFAAQRLKDAVVLSVTDRGPGIPADVQDKVFDWFETHSLGSRHRGTGLGLSLVRSFVELHGGSVRLESAVGRGTTVTCVFPLDHRAERTAA